MTVCGARTAARMATDHRRLVPPLCLALVGAAVLVSACGGDRRASARSDGALRDSARPARDIVPAESARATGPASDATAASDLWSRGEVTRRLTEAGLVVTDSAREMHHQGIHVPGDKLGVSRGALEIYVYPTVAARRRDSAALDTATHRLPSISDPHFIFSGNLIAILHTPSDREVEQVSDALTARHNPGGS